MALEAAQILGSIFTLSEMGLGVLKRAGKGKSQLADRGTLVLLWVVIVASIVTAYSLRAGLPALI